MSDAFGQAPESFAGLTIGVVGATGAAGSTVLRVLEQRHPEVTDIAVMASARSVGRTCEFRGEIVEVTEATPASIRGIDVVFLAAGGGTARELAPEIAAAGGLAIDKSSAFRADPAIPLVVPEVNGSTLAASDRIIANPNCVAIPLSIVLSPLLQAAGIEAVTLATYQAASGGGRALREELSGQRRAVAAGHRADASVYPHVLEGNVVPGGWTVTGSWMEEEEKVVAEARRVLGNADLPISITTVRVPVEVGHSAAVWVDCGRTVTAAEVRELMASSAGITLLDDPGADLYPTPLRAAGQDSVLVGRIRVEGPENRRVALFWSADNLRKGAATNAVQVAELALAIGRKMGAASTV